MNVGVLREVFLFTLFPQSSALPLGSRVSYGPELSLDFFFTFTVFGSVILRMCHAHLVPSSENKRFIPGFRRLYFVALSISFSPPSLVIIIYSSSRVCEYCPTCCDREVPPVPPLMARPRSVALLPISYFTALIFPFNLARHGVFYPGHKGWGGVGFFAAHFWWGVTFNPLFDSKVMSRLAVSGALFS